MLRAAEHLVHKHGIRLFLWEKHRTEDAHAFARTGRIILLVHGASYSGVTTFDLQVPGKPGHSLMDFLAERGYDAWALDIEGYGRSDRPINHTSDTVVAAEDIRTACEYIFQHRKVARLHFLGFSWGTQSAALFASSYPHWVHRLILLAPVSPESPWVESLRSHLETYQRQRYRANTVEGVKARVLASIPAQAIDPQVLEYYAMLAVGRDPSSPNGCLMDILTRMPLVDYGKLSVPTLIIHGEFDDAARQDDLTLRFREIPSNDKQYLVLPGLGHMALIERNRHVLTHALLNFLEVPGPAW